MNYQSKPILADQHPLSKLIFSSLAVIIIGLVFQLIAIGLSALFFNVGIIDLADLSGEPGRDQINAMKLVQIIGALGTFVFSSLLISRFYTGSWLGFFPFGRTLDSRALILLIIIMVTALPFVNLLTEINLKFKIPFESIENYLRNLEEQTETLMMTLLNAEKFGGLLVNLFMIAIIPAIGEELVFRGLIQKHLTDLFKKNVHLAILIAAVIFSLAHFQMYSFLPRFFLGVILGYLFYYGKSLWYPVIAHLVNNTLGVLFYYFYTRSEAGDSIEEIGTVDMLPMMAIFSLLLVAGLLYYYIKIIRSNEALSGSSPEKDSSR